MAFLNVIWCDAMHDLRVCGIEYIAMRYHVFSYISVYWEGTTVYTPSTYRYVA